MALLSSLSLLNLAIAAMGAPPASSGAKYLITFGDSYSQTGFNDTLAWPSAADPLGNPALPGWTASGGLNWVGFLTSVFNTSLVLTYNYAYGGATTDASLVAGYEPTVLSFIDQVALFNASIASHPPEAPWTSENSLFGVWMGVNDVGNSFYLSNETTRVEEIVDVYFEQLQALYSAGARNFVLLGVPPVQQTPLMLANIPMEQDAEAAAIAEYNDLLVSKLADFSRANRGVTGKVINTTTAFETAISNPEAYGAPNASCYDSDGTSCLWFNNYHPGIAINRLVAEEVVAAWNESFFRPRESGRFFGRFFGLRSLW